MPADLAPDLPDGAVRIDVGGCRLFGAWSRPPLPGRTALVFLHDGLGSVETLRQLPSRLADALSLPAFAYDRPGYGRSDPVERFSADFMSEAADQLELVLEAAGIEDCCLVGHSDGGTVALLHGARYRGRVRAIVSIAAHVRRDRLTLGQVRRHLEMVDDVPDWMARFHGARAAHLLRIWAEAWLQCGDWNICDEIAAVEAPLLALQGENDAYGLPDQLEDIGRFVRHAETELLEGAGHFPHLEDPERIVRRVRRFLDPYAGRPAVSP